MLKKIEEAYVLNLLGGKPLTQIDYIKEAKYYNLIKEFSKIIIGISEGAKNLEKIVYCSKDEDFDENLFYEGLGLIDITMDSHFDINNEEQVDEIKKILLLKKL